MAQAVRPEPFYTSLFYYKTISQPDPLAAGMPGQREIDHAKKQTIVYPHWPSRMRWRDKGEAQAPVRP